MASYNTKYGTKYYTTGGYGTSGHRSTDRNLSDAYSRLPSDYAGLHSTDRSPYNSRSTSPLHFSSQDNQRNRKISEEATEIDKIPTKTRASEGTSSNSNLTQLLDFLQKYKTINVDEIEKEIVDLKNTIRTESRHGNDTNRELQQLKEKCMALEDTNESFKKKYSQAVEDKSELEEKFKILHDEFKIKKKEIEHLERVVSDKDNELRRIRSDKDEELRQLRTDKESALSRLSMQMGDKLNKDNAAIADLSDPQRSTKVAELYNAIYDNEWTDALETLQTCELEEENAIRTLLEIVRHIYDFCGNLKEDHIQQLERQLMNPFSKRQATVQETTSHRPVQKQVRSMLMNCIKVGAKEVVSTLTKNYLSISKKPQFTDRIPEYVEKAIELCWLMHMCSPPLVFGDTPRTGETLDKTLYKEYTKQGDIVSFVVWFPLLIEKDGAVLTKGVAQPIPSVTNKSRTTGKIWSRQEDSHDYKTERNPVRKTKQSRDEILAEIFKSNSSGSRIHTERYSDTNLGTKDYLYGKDKGRTETEFSSRLPGNDFSKTYTGHNSASEFMKKHFAKDDYEHQHYRTNDNVSDWRDKDRTSESEKGYMNYESNEKYKSPTSDSRLREKRGYTDNQSTDKRTQIDDTEYAYHHDGRLIFKSNTDGKWRYVK